MSASEVEEQKYAMGETYDPVTGDVALLNRAPVLCAGVLAEGALAAGAEVCVGSREGGGGKGEDGGGELHFAWSVWRDRLLR